MMMPSDRTAPGTRFQALVVIGPSASKTSGRRSRTMLILRCDCGKRIIKPRDDLIRGRLKSCGCK